MVPGVSSLTVSKKGSVAVLAVGLLGAAAWLGGETLLPRAELGVQRVHVEELHKGLGKVGRIFAQRQPWLVVGDWLLYLPTADPKRRRFEGVTLYRLAGGAIAELHEAAALVYEADAGGWVLHDVVSHLAQESRTLRQARRPLALPLGSEDLMEVTGDPRQLTTTQLGGLIARREQAGLESVGYRVYWHGRWAHPLQGLALLLLAAPWLFSPGRRRGLAARVGWAVVILGAVLGLGQAVRLAAVAGDLPPPLGGWAGVLIALLAAPLAPAVGWLLRLRRRRGLGGERR